MKNRTLPILFDKEDHDLLDIVNEVLHRDKSRVYIKNLLNPYLHPHGIREMAASRELRIAYAVAHLLNSLDVGEAKDRLSALRSLRDEVLSSAETPFRMNTARVLVQIMKMLVRRQGDLRSRLELAHDFRLAASGRPRVIREQLSRHHLLEMPEEWNQIATDDHVHDVNTKGRKSPSHLIMDAWIKGIRRLKIIYYNYVKADVAEELLEAAQIMGIRVRIGIEFTPRFRDRYVQIIWAPRGLLDTQDYLNFLKEPHVAAFTEEGEKVSEYKQRYVLAILDEFNSRHRNTIKQTYGIDLDPIEESEFLEFVGIGQMSILHLAELIHTRMLPAMQARTEELRSIHTLSGEKDRDEIERLVDDMNNLDSEAIVEKFLRPSSNPGIPDPNTPRDDPDLPGLLRLSPSELVERFERLHSGYSITLGLSGLEVEDVLEIIYDCGGKITHLENFNLKDYITGKTPPYGEINELQRALNSGNVISLKRILQSIIHKVDSSDHPDRESRKEKLTTILHDIGSLHGLYDNSILTSRIGSDSAGRSHHLYGMGLVIRETLPSRVQKNIQTTLSDSRFIVPIHTRVYLRVAYIPREISSPFIRGLSRWAKNVPGLRFIGKRRQEEWVTIKNSTVIGGQGNVVTLGGIDVERTNQLFLHPPEEHERSNPVSWRYMNSTLKNWIKILLGFLPAFLTFYLTKDWWLLGYFGAFIWFGITGLRNILQSVLGGGGFRRSPLLKWDDYVSWERLTDSLLFTGFSVPLLDYVIKTVILDRMFGITVATGPVVLYTVMAIANGIYISSHNAFRGFQKGVIIGNFFRTVLSIPLAILFNIVLGAILFAFGIPGVNLVLQKWAAIISKAASDCVAGIIEGLADRYRNIDIRQRDYRSKLDQLFNSYALMEIFFPESDILKMLDSPDELFRKLHSEATDLEHIVSIHALDLLYFWMYQPRAEGALRMIMKELSPEELRIFVQTQSILSREREISQLFLDGIVGKNFSRALSFYLDRSGQYLRTIRNEA